jgi:hypothetical protein
MAVTASIRAALRSSYFSVVAVFTCVAGVTAYANVLPVLSADDRGAIFVVAVLSSVLSEFTLWVVSEADFDFRR